ncbi:MAG TPA: tetratricopeptide repeat protein, partial [Bryobacterales bacterium]|nr:tetratricopeptide repeat protein [Bryobacterales bacterium]
MTAVARKLAVAAGFSLLFLFVSAAPAVAQTSAIEGEVIGEDGNPVKGALILIERQDIRGTYKVKTNKKGRFFHAGLPLGTYVVKCLINDKVVDQVNGVRTTLGENTQVNFDLQALARKRQALQQAAASGQLTEEQMRGLTPEQREALKRQMEERAKAMRKNKALNDAYNAAMQAKQARQWDTAIQNFQKAIEIDPKQHVVWAQLADTYVNKANSVGGPARQEALEKAIEAYRKVLELMPQDAAYHNNFGLVLARAGRLEEAQAELKKAAELNPADAGKYYYNLGAVLVNTGKQEEAMQAFKMAIDADPTYANAWFQYGMALLAKAKIGEDGSIIPP